MFGAPFILVLAACWSGPRPAPPHGQVWVPTARSDIPAGAALHPADIQWVSLPDEFVGDRVVRDDAELEGTQAESRLLAGEFIRRERLRPYFGETLQAASSFAPAVVADPMQVVRAVVFAHNLPAGQTVLPQHLYAISVPPQYLPPHVFLDPARIVGLATCEAVLVNEFVRAERLRNPATGRCAEPDTLIP